MTNGACVVFVSWNPLTKLEFHPPLYSPYTHGIRKFMFYIFHMHLFWFLVAYTLLHNNVTIIKWVTHQWVVCGQLPESV